jgi:quercetin dioxygenase-like cupin family protein
MERSAEATAGRVLTSTGEMSGAGQGSTPIIRADGEGERLWFAGGGQFMIKASSAETGGAFLLFEDRMVRGKTTPLHYHPEADEAIIVLEGELLVHVNGANHPAGPGSVTVIPRGVIHALLVTSDDARVLALVTPGKSEAFFRDASEPVTDELEPPRPPDWERLRKAAANNPSVIQIVGPPPFDLPR